MGKKLTLTKSFVERCGQCGSDHVYWMTEDCFKNHPNSVHVIDIQLSDNSCDRCHEAYHDWEAAVLRTTIDSPPCIHPDDFVKEGFNQVQWKSEIIKDIK